MCMEYSCMIIDGLDSEYEYGYKYYPWDENEDPDVKFSGVFTIDGYKEAFFDYDDYYYGDYTSEGYYLNNEEYTEFATQKRDTAVAAMQTFIDHLLAECDLERQDLFITK